MSSFDLEDNELQKSLFSSTVTTNFLSFNLLSGSVITRLTSISISLS